jgi:prepilin-type N-terminal cleavage/methylation domain-containing protein
MSRRGFTLLEVMVALVVLAAVGTAVLQVVAASSRTTRDLETWTAAVAAAENGLAIATLGAPEAEALAPLPAGVTRRVARRAGGAGLVEVTVTVTLPDGRRFALSELVPEGP